MNASAKQRVVKDCNFSVQKLISSHASIQIWFWESHFKKRKEITILFENRDR